MSKKKLMKPEPTSEPPPVTPTPSAAPLPPLPEYVDTARLAYANACEDMGMAHASGTREDWLRAVDKEMSTRAALNAAIRRHAEEAARGAGACGCTEGGQCTTHAAEHRCGEAGPFCDHESHGDPRPAGCVCPVERVVKVLRSCTKHGEREP